MMNLLASHYFIAIIMVSVSRVQPFHTEILSWIHDHDPQYQHQQKFNNNNQLLSHNVQAQRSSFGGECPDCLSQKKASLRLLLLTSKFNNKTTHINSSSSSTTTSSSEVEVVEPQHQHHHHQQHQPNFQSSEESPLLSSSNRRRRKRSFQESSSGDLIHSRRGARSSTPCLQEREERLRSQQEYIPNCRRDGSYAHVQCHPQTRSCWCVTRSGRPIPGSSILASDSNPGARPSCAKYNRRAKSQTRRRSSQIRKNRKCTGVSSSCHNGHNNRHGHHTFSVGGGGDSDDDDFDSSDDDDDDLSDEDLDSDDDDHDDIDEYNRDDLSCNQADWSRFNMALLKTFRSEYNRYRLLTSTNPDMESTPSDTTVLSWKFDHVDRNKDMILQRNETNILKNLVKQQIQPRSCAKNFIASCSNGDQQITKSEWLDCLRVSSDVNLPFDTFNSLVDSSTSRGMHPSLLLKPVSSSSTSGSGSASLELTPPLLSSGTVGETTEQSNCWTDRQSALASQKQNESIIIPECTANGNYRKVQCAQVLLTGKAYCWCVEEESGVQIPNTVVFATTPDCNNRYSKPMKGCSGQKKHKFLMDLFSSLKSRMLDATREGGRRGQGDISRSMSPEEQASRWYFSELDVNTNGVLDRKEWKTFRNETSQDKRLKKCGKKLPRHCDVNQDKKITITEWLDCLGVKFLGRVPTHSSSGKRTVNRSNGPRSGKNPFTTILKQRRR